jgi:hypothetical protein
LALNGLCDAGAGERQEKFERRVAVDSSAIAVSTSVYMIYDLTSPYSGMFRPSTAVARSEGNGSGRGSAAESPLRSTVVAGRPFAS